MTLNLGRSFMVLERSEFSLCSRESPICLFRYFYAPPLGHKMQNAKSSPGAKPAFANFLKVLETVDYITSGVFVWKVEQMYCTSGMRNVNDNIADLT